ncbi:MAG: Gfo/Idh/MocA family protein [Gammaproteobacteria bacterium]
MDNTPVKWAILGTSPISSVMAKAIQESSISQLVAIGSRSLDKAQTFADEFAIPKIYSDYFALLADDEIDVIYLGLPNHLHKEWIIHCAHAGKHILCEKPFVTDLAEAQDVFAILQKSNVFCMEALMYRCHPFTTKLLELVQSKVIGELVYINAAYTAHIADVANTTKGGAILNLGCYPVSLIRLLVGAEPIAMHALGEIDRARNNDCRASMVLKFPKDVMANVYTADDVKMFSQFAIYGTQGHIQVITNPWLPTRENNQIRIFLNNESSPTEINVTADKSLYTYQIDMVSQNVLAEQRSAELPGISWIDSLGNVAVLEAWREQLFYAEAALV